MKLFYLICCIHCLTSSIATAQDEIKHKKYTSLEEALAEPQKVYKLDLGKQGLKEIPAELAQFPNLTNLDLKKNTITEVATPMNKSSLLAI